MKNEEHKMIKMVNKAGRLTEGAKKAFEGAFICGPFNECIRVPGMIECDRTGCHETAKARKVAALLDSLNIGWKIEDDFATIYRVARFREALEDISPVAAYEFSWIVKGFAEADKD